MKNGVPADVWAYIIALLTLGYLKYIIGWRKNFPRSKHEDIIKYYRRLIKGNIGLLMEYLENYNKDKIQRNIHEASRTGKNGDNRMLYESESNKSKKEKSQSLNNKVLHNVIFHRNLLKGLLL